LPATATTPLSGTRSLGLATINVHTIFEVSSLSHSRDWDYKFKMDHATWPRPFQLRFVIWRLGHAMFIHQIWSVDDYLQRRYERQRQM